MTKCYHGTPNCIHRDKEHDEDCCFDGWFRHEYICQECVYTQKSMNATGKFPARTCPNCKSRESFV